MNPWQAFYVLLFIFGTAGIVYLIAEAVLRSLPKRNRRKGLPAPRPDARNWQAEFTRSLRP